MHPYDEQSPEITEKWYRKTPSWANNMPGYYALNICFCNAINYLKLNRCYIHELFILEQL